MKKILLICFPLFICMAQQVKASECRLEASLPAQSPRALSNGKTILVPTFARDFRSLIVFGGMDGGAVGRILKESGLHPLQVKVMGKTHAVGALSFFDYRDSDMGAFREIYLVVVATKKKTGVLGSLKEFLRALRPPGEATETDLVLFHLKAYSSSESGVLGSREIWKIDSVPAEIEAIQSGQWLQFAFGPGEGKPAVSSFDLKSFVRLPGRVYFGLDASGPAFEGKEAFSHVFSCAETSFSLFNPDRHRLSVGEELEASLKKFDLRPWFIEYSPRSQAIQFLPR